MRKQRKDYKLPPAVARLSGAAEPSDLVLHFPLLDGSGSVQTLDFTRHGGRPRLVAALALAVRHHFIDKRPISRCRLPDYLATFVVFLDAEDPTRALVLSARDITGDLLLAYTTWLRAHFPSKATAACYWWALKVPLAWLMRCRPDLVRPDLQFPFNPFPRRNADARSHARLSREEVEAVLTACRSEIEASWADFERGQTLLKEQVDADEACALLPAARLVRPDAGLGQLLATLVRDFGGLVPAAPTYPARDQLPWGLRCCLDAHGGRERVRRFLHATPDTLVPYMVAIAAQTFANPDALRGMRRNCMSEDVMLDRRVHVAWHKGRSGRMQRRTFLRDRGMSVPNLVDRVLALTAPLLPHVPPHERDLLFLVGDGYGQRAVTRLTTLKDCVGRLAERHGLRTPTGAALRLTLACLRPTGLALAHTALGGDIVKTQSLANHADVETTRRYVAAPAIRAEGQARLASLQGRFVEVVRSKRPLLIHSTAAAESGGRAGGAVPGDARCQGGEGLDMSNATGSGFVCADPIAGAGPGQRPGRLCTAWLGCFTCPNAVIPLDAGILARLLHTRDALTEARRRLSSERWFLLYAPKLEILERDILPRFEPQMHAAAALLAADVPTPPPIE